MSCRSLSGIFCSSGRRSAGGRQLVVQAARCTMQPDIKMAFAVFKTLPVVEQAYRDESLPSSARDFRRDTIALGWEERMKSRGRRRSSGGVEFGTSLPRGTILRGGDQLVVESAQVVVEVVEQLEAVFVVEPRTREEWGLFAYHIGNGHQPLMITDRALVCPEVPGAEILLQYHGIPYVRAQTAFTPAAVGHKHQ